MEKQLETALLNVVDGVFGAFDSLETDTPNFKVKAYRLNNGTGAIRVDIRPKVKGKVIEPVVETAAVIGGCGKGSEDIPQKEPLVIAPIIPNTGGVFTPSNPRKKFASTRIVN
jgi:hypothetical protein